MHFIAHRGNTKGPNSELENHPEYIRKALIEGYEVEVDLWREADQWVLGHDEPQYEISEAFLTPYLKTNQLWLHIKNIDGLDFLAHQRHSTETVWNYFWHQKDDYTLTTGGFIWAYPGQRLTSKTICVMPERTNYTKTDISHAAGICSDFISTYKGSYQ